MTATQNPAQDVSDRALGAAFREVMNGSFDIDAIYFVNKVNVRARELQQSSAPVVVTDEMVIAACLTYETAMDGDVRRLDVPWIAMKAALESALTGRAK